MSARILARKSVSVSASWNASLTTLQSLKVNLLSSKVCLKHSSQSIFLYSCHTCIIAVYIAVMTLLLHAVGDVVVLQVQRSRRGNSCIWLNSPQFWISTDQSPLEDSDVLSKLHQIVGACCLWLCGSVLLL